MNNCSCQHRLQFTADDAVFQLQLCGPRAIYSIFTDLRICQREGSNPNRFNCGKRGEESSPPPFVAVSSP